MTVRDMDRETGEGMETAANSKYDDYIRGKRVIFVGPSPVLENTGMGEWIDSFDVVVRANRWFNIHNFHQDYGSRMDVWYCNIAYERRYRPLDLKHNGAQWACFKSSYPDQYNTIMNCRTCREGRTAAKKLTENPLMLLILIYDLIIHGAAELWVDGIDLYQNERKYVSQYHDDNTVKWSDVLQSHRVNEHIQIMRQLHTGTLIQMRDQIAECLEV